ncbi:trypsin-like peptidase domain-containing protein [Streptomyces sp. NPDC003283]|uniref:trypsin-like peptidase domain-containing protein n=1 Tax=Streptomyces sp. NPDC003283 TaxID=3364681 RepID=UPI003675F6EF
MNEGKPTRPTRPRWWSRPRPPAPTDDTVGTAPVPDTTTDDEGDFHLARPARSPEPQNRSTPQPGDRPEDQPGGQPEDQPGDHTDAAAPAAAAGYAPVPVPRDALAGGTAPAPESGAGGASVPGLGSAPGAVPAAVPGPDRADEDRPGDHTDAAAPAAAAGYAPVPAPRDAPAGGPERASAPVPGPAPEAAPAPTPGPGPEYGSLPAPGSGSVDGSAAASASASAGPVAAALDAERRRPLHAPDPYGTPPYGQPGPWAPAPPFQHPAVAPAASGAAPAPADPLGPPAAAPAPPAPMASGEHPVEPGAAPAVPAPASAPLAAHGGALTPGAGDPPPSPLPHAAPPPLPPPHAPAHLPAPAAPVVPPDPWQRYDPWAARPLAGPLQESGAGVVGAEQRRRRVRRALVGGAVALALVAGGIGGAVGAYLERNGGIGTVTLPQAGKEPADRAPDSVAGIAARALPGVVTLHVSGSDEQGTGTGFVLDGRGHILTNNHVVGPAAAGGEISVTFSGGQTARGTIVGRDTGYDLAVVRVRGVRGLTPMPLGNSDNVRVGDPVVAIGAPFDLANTVTSGIISAKERPITAGGEKGDGSDVSYVDALQTDAPINPGNSGGPLLDSRGRVVGINSAIRSADSGSDAQTGQAGSIGLGFAIPVNQAKRVAEELINTGRASHPVIGVTLDMAYEGDGAKVGARASGGGSPVTPGGPGAAAGIRAGDVVTAVDGVRVHSGEELIVRTRAHRPGDRLELTVERDGRQRKISLVLGSSDSG